MSLSDDSLRYIASQLGHPKTSQMDPAAPAGPTEPGVAQPTEYGSVASSNLEVLIASVNDPSEYPQVLETLISFLDDSVADKAIRDTISTLYPPKDYS